MALADVDIDASLVRRLLTTQFPQWADLSLEPVPSAGTDNALYRLGDDMVVRLPRKTWAIGQADKEHRWLPLLAPHLPLAVPEPLGKGDPGEGYPWTWSVHRWLDGEDATVRSPDDLRRAAADLAAFVGALQEVDVTHGPPSGEHNVHRGVPLAARDPLTRVAIDELDGLLDARAVTAAWESALGAPVWDGPPRWIHGDLQSGNLLVREGRLSAVIDFGLLGVGDPACDLMIAWTFLGKEERASFRAALAVDDATWERGRGWTVSVGVSQLAAYLEANPVLSGIARRGIDEVLADRS